MWHVFVDTSAFFALTVVEDQNHIHTRELFAQAYRESWSLVTTNAVVAETHALILNRARPGREKALEFLEAIGADAYRMVRVRKTDEDKAIALIRAHRDSLCDALSFVVMERLRIREAISLDQDFRSYGRFTVLS